MTPDSSIICQHECVIILVSGSFNLSWNDAPQSMVLHLLFLLHISHRLWTSRWLCPFMHQFAQLETRSSSRPRLQSKRARIIELKDWHIRRIIIWRPPWSLPNNSTWTYTLTSFPLRQSSLAPLIKRLGVSHNNWYETPMYRVPISPDWSFDQKPKISKLRNWETQIDNGGMISQTQWNQAQIALMIEVLHYCIYWNIPSTTKPPSPKSRKRKEMLSQIGQPHKFTHWQYAMSLIICLISSSPS
jgi:hypothetical protein